MVVGPVVSPSKATHETPVRSSVARPVKTARKPPVKSAGGEKPAFVSAPILPRLPVSPGVGRSFANVAVSLAPKKAPQAAAPVPVLGRQSSKKLTSSKTLDKKNGNILNFPKKINPRVKDGGDLFLSKGNSDVHDSELDMALSRKPPAPRDANARMKTAGAVFAASKAADIIRSWKHFEVVVTQPTSLTSKNSDRRVTPVEPLPPWLRISRLGQDKVDLLYYHSAVMIAFCGAGEDENYEAEEVEAIIYTPHGITPEDLKPVATAEPPIRTLALLHGLHDVRIGPQLNLGAHNGLKVQRLTKAKYWVGTHDEVKRGGGIVSWLLKRYVYTVKDAIEQEVQEIGQDVDDSMTDVHFAELGNGESLLLE
jgi:hypothetical protein